MARRIWWKSRGKENERTRKPKIMDSMRIQKEKVNPTAHQRHRRQLAVPSHGRKRQYATLKSYFASESRRWDARRRVALLRLCSRSRRRRHLFSTTTSHLHQDVVAKDFFSLSVTVADEWNCLPESVVPSVLLTRSRSASTSSWDVEDMSIKSGSLLQLITAELN